MRRLTCELISKAAQMDACTDTLIRNMRIDERIMVLTADLVGSCRLNKIELEFPDRFINVGIAEQNMMGIAAGLAREGMLPFVFSFSVFTSLRAADQLRTDIFYNGLNVKVVGTHSGVSTGQAGSTHFSLEDVGVVRSMPKSKIIVPADAVSTGKAVEALLRLKEPAYLRLDRNSLPVLYEQMDEFQIGKGIVLQTGKRRAVISMGSMVAVAKAAAKIVFKSTGEKIAVIDMHTVKPIDKDLVRLYSTCCSQIYTLEEHNIYGGLGSAVAEIIAGEGQPCRLYRLGIQDDYPKGGPVEAVRARLGLEAKQIADIIIESGEG